MRSILSLSPRTVWLLLLLAAILKAVVLFLIIPTVGNIASESFRADPFQDGYADIAWNLINGNGYNLLPQASGTMFRTPGYVLFLAPVFAAFGKSIVAVQIAQYFLSFGTAYLTYRLAKTISKTRAIGIIAAILFLLSPAAIMSDNRALIESFLTFCAVAFLLLLYQALATNRLTHWIFAGAAFGWLLLVRSSAALFPLFLVFLIYRNDRSSPSGISLKRVTASFGAFCIATAVVVAPWVVRNYFLSGSFEPTMTVRGAAVFQSVYLAQAGEKEKDELVSFVKASALLDQFAREMNVPYKPGFLPYFYDIQSEVTYYNNLGNLAVETLKSDPALLPRMIFNNAFRFWFKGVTPGASYVYFIAIMPLLILTVVGTAVAVRRNLNIIPLMTFAIAYYISYLPTLAFGRYCMPVLPYLAIGSAITIHAWLTRQSAAEGPASLTGAN